MSVITISELKPRTAGGTPNSLALTLYSGKITALAGLTDGGKELLIRAAAGADGHYTARVVCPDTETVPATPREAVENGIAALYPQPLIFPELTALENIGLLSQCSLRRLRRETLPLAAALWRRLTDTDFPTDSRGSALTLAAQRLLEIVRALLHHPRLLLLNEVLVTFDQPLKQRLFTVLREHTDLTVLFTTTAPADVEQFADYYYALRDGQLTPVKSVTAETAQELTRTLYDYGSGQTATLRSGKTILEILGLVLRPQAPDISLTLRQGEILGITGLGESGLEDFSALFSGRLSAIKGVLTVAGKNLRLRSASAKAIARAGVAVYDGGVSKLTKSSAAALAEMKAVLADINAASSAAVYVFSGIDISGENPAACCLREKLPELAAAGKAVILLSTNFDALLCYTNTLAVFHAGKLCPPRAVEKWSRSDVALFAECGQGGIISLL